MILVVGVTSVMVGSDIVGVTSVMVASYVSYHAYSNEQAVLSVYKFVSYKYIK